MIGKKAIGSSEVKDLNMSLGVLMKYKNGKQLSTKCGELIKRGCGPSSSLPDKLICECILVQVRRVVADPNDGLGCIKPILLILAGNLHPFRVRG